MAGGLSINIQGGLQTGSAHVQIYPDQLAKVLKGPDGDVYRFMFRVGDAVVERAKTEVGVDTGNLRDHIVKRMVQFPSGFGVIVVADTPYAIYHHEGSRAVNGKLMVFEAKDGTLVFTMRRKAIPPNRFLIRAIDAIRSMI